MLRAWDIQTGFRCVQGSPEGSICICSVHGLYRLSKGGHQILKTFLVTQLQSSGVGEMVGILC